MMLNIWAATKKLRLPSFCFARFPSPGTICKDSSEKDSKHIVIPSNIHFTNFKLSLDEKQTLIDDGYNLTKQHIKHYKLTNDLLNEQHHEDLSPTEGDLDS